MNGHARLAALLLALTLLTGCVERRFVITVDPPGAVVYCNGDNLGVAGLAPGGGLDKFFVYYGKYRFTIVKDGYVTLTTEELVATPWYEVPPLDFFSENVYPFRVSDVRRLHFKLEKATKENGANLLNQSLPLMEKTNQIVSPVAPPPPPGTTGCVPVILAQPTVVPPAQPSVLPPTPATGLPPTPPAGLPPASSPATSSSGPGNSALR
jgi:hypothetical protein